MAIEVRTSKELQAALKSDVNEIVVLDEDLAKKLKAVRYIQRLGPIAVAGVIAAIPFIASTGGLGAGAIALAAPSAAWSTAAVVALVVSIGGTIAISLFTDWEYVELPFGIKLKRKGKNNDPDDECGTPVR